MSLNKNVYPYFDDFDATKGYHRIMFHPAKPVQARELTQLQSILQEQVKRHGDHVFKNGTVVEPGHLFYDNKVRFLKLETIHNDVNIDSYLPSLINKTIVGDTNSIEALVVHATPKTDTDPTTLFIKYSTGGGGVSEFAAGETMTVKGAPGVLLKVTPVTTYTGDGSVCFIGAGIFYINGYFVSVADQIIDISKYSSNASAIIGLDYTETFVTENEDETLYDNAYGFSNYGAPGAHRLKITLSLAMKPYDYAINNASEIAFIDLLKIKEGQIEYLKNDTQYAEIEKWLARRTFDESGSYVVAPFELSCIDYRSNDRGPWVKTTPYLIGDVVSNGTQFYIALGTGYSGASAPAHTFGVQSDGILYWNQITNKTQFINSGQTSQVSGDLYEHIKDEQYMFVSVSTGKAYINGFERVFNAPSYIKVNKARTTKQIDNSQIYSPAGTYIVVDNVRGLPNVSTSLTKINLLDVAGATIGTAWVRSLEYKEGSLATPNTVKYKLFVFGMALNSDKNFKRDVHTVSSTLFTATIVATLTQLSGSLAVTSIGTAVTGNGTYFDYELAVGDRVLIGTTWAVVASITSPTAFVATASLAIIAAGASGFIGTSTQIKSGNYITPLASSAINTLRDSTGAVDTEYVISKYYTFTTSGTSHVLTLTNGETFLPSKHIVTLNAGTVAASTLVNATFVLNGPATQLTISGLVTATDYKALLLVKRVGAFAKEKTKSFTVKTITLNNAGTSKYSNKIISLTEADCIRVVKVTQSGDAADKVNYVELNEVDVTRSFSFENGQREEYYGLGSIRTTQTFTRPLRVTFEYFDHSDGDYFSVDSYSTVPRIMWPVQTINDTEYFLPDYIDFRSRISDSGTEFNNASGGAVSAPLHSDYTISTSYSYYLPRFDKVSITNQGEVLYDESSQLNTGMQLGDAVVSPYTFNAKTGVKFTDTQIRNYTMEEVGSIDSRVQAVEYYVALSELEKNTLETSITDQFGLQRTKYGFIVDDFVNHAVGDILNEDFKVSLIYETKTCVPQMTVEVPKLIEPEGTSDGTRRARNYQLTGKYLTLPYEEATFISQRIASRSINIQAYVSFDFTGVMTITPPEDNWVDNVSVVTTNGALTPPPVVANVVVAAPARRCGGRRRRRRRCGRSIICAKLFELGLLDTNINEADQSFGEMLLLTNPDVYWGYIAWAETVVEWMEGIGPNIMPWIKDDAARIEKTKKWATKWAHEIAKPWSQEMAYRMGAVKTGNLAGKVLMGLGLPMCKMIGLWIKVFDKPKSDSMVRSYALLIALSAAKVIVNIFDRS